MGKLKEILKSWQELLMKGYFQAQVTGREVKIVIRARVTGDMLNILQPAKEGVVLSADEVLEIVRSDDAFSDDLEKALGELRRKFMSLKWIPVVISWVVNLAIGTFYLDRQWENVRQLLTQSYLWQDIKPLLPWAVFALLSLLFGRSFGLKLMKPFVMFIAWVIRAVRWIRNRKVENAAR